MGLGQDNCKTKRETFEFGDLVRLILEILRWFIYKWPVGVSIVFQRSLPVPCTTLTTGNCLPLGQCKETVNESRATAMLFQSREYVIKRNMIMTLVIHHIIRINFCLFFQTINERESSSFFSKNEILIQSNQFWIAALKHYNGVIMRDSPHKGPVTRKMFPFDDVIMKYRYWFNSFGYWWPVSLSTEI